MDLQVRFGVEQLKREEREKKYFIWFLFGLSFLINFVFVGQILEKKNLTNISIAEIERFFLKKCITVSF